MNDSTRNDLKEILAEGYRNLLRQVCAINPGRIHGDGFQSQRFFPFRSYAQYSCENAVVVVPLDIKKRGHGFHISGDLCRGNGFILAKLTEVLVIAGPNEDEKLRGHANIFILSCKKNAALIALEMRKGEEP